jgi:hypothetical protein
VPRGLFPGGYGPEMSSGTALLGKLVGAALTVAGALIIAVGVLAVSFGSFKTAPGRSLIFIPLIIGVGIGLFWVGNRMQGWGFFGKVDPSDQ